MTRKIPDGGDLFKTATHWRLRAEKMRALAEETYDPAVGAMMLRFAASYDRIGERADNPAAQVSIMFRQPDLAPEAAAYARLRLPCRAAPI